MDQLHIGKIIIYKIEGLYIRYLEIITIKNLKSSNEEQFNGIVAQNIPFVVIQGPYNKILKIKYEDFQK
ncbi:MAG: hypothetical protein PHY59_00940 [Methanobacterium sp.]|nr:hypothetical protein [Methanobacterium sp.]